jgi:hypothetical protein
MFLAPWPARKRDRSSLNSTSSSQCMLSTPQCPRAAGGPFDDERCGRNIEPGVERASVRVFGFIDHTKDRLDAFEARPAWIGPVAADPIEHLGGRVFAGFDAAVTFLDRGFRHQFLGGGGFEIVGDLPFHRWWLPFSGNRKSALCSTILAATSTWHPMASMVTRVP